MKLLCIELRRCERPSRMSPLLEVTEDTPPDMLAGSMDLRLVLPDGKRVRMSVDRRTPMMDLLVQVTTAYKISPAGNVLQPYGETGLLPYKPSTPIGALDTWIVHIVPKNQALQNPSNKINLKQIIPPFEQTLRFQVNLPRNQLYVTRVSGRCSMQDILHQACSEKNLDPSKYTLRHPKQLDKPLYDELSIAEYGHNQVTMLSVKSLPTAVSTEDILLMNNKYKTQSDSGSGSAASSVSPVVPVQPSKPIRKRRPAPKPPAQQQPLQKQQSETIICHSRTSSDSSGYHEASVLSESPDSNNSSLPDSLPRRSKLPSAETSNTRETNKLSRSLSNLHQASTSAAANSSLKPAQSVSCLAPSRKKKPAPAPPIAIVEEKEEKSATLPPCTRLMEAPGDERIAVQHQVNSKMSPARDCSPVNTVDKFKGHYSSKAFPSISYCSSSIKTSVEISHTQPVSKLLHNFESLSNLSSSQLLTENHSIPVGHVKSLSEKFSFSSEMPAFHDKTKPFIRLYNNSSENTKHPYWSHNFNRSMRTFSECSLASIDETVPKRKFSSASDSVHVIPSNLIEELEARISGKTTANSVKTLLKRFENVNPITSPSKSELSSVTEKFEESFNETKKGNFYDNLSVISTDSFLGAAGGEELDTSFFGGHENKAIEKSDISDLLKSLSDKTELCTDKRLIGKKEISSLSMENDIVGIENQEPEVNSNILETRGVLYSNRDCCEEIESCKLKKRVKSYPNVIGGPNENAIDLENFEDENFIDSNDDMDTIDEKFLKINGACNFEAIRDDSTTYELEACHDESSMNKLPREHSPVEWVSETQSTNFNYALDVNEKNIQQSNLFVYDETDEITNDVEVLGLTAVNGMSAKSAIIQGGIGNKYETNSDICTYKMDTKGTIDIYSSDTNCSVSEDVKCNYLPPFVEKPEDDHNNFEIDLNEVVSEIDIHSNNFSLGTIASEKNYVINESKATFDQNLNIINVRSKSGFEESLASCVNQNFESKLIPNGNIDEMTQSKISGRRESVFSNSSGIYECMDSIHEKIMENTATTKVIKGKNKNKTVTFCEPVKEIDSSSEEGSIRKSKPEKSRFSSPLRLDMWARKGKALLTRKKKKTQQQSWTHSDNIKSHNFCSCPEPDIVYVEVPKILPTIEESLMKRNESPMSDTSNHTYMVMEGIKPISPEVPYEMSESEMVHKKLLDLLNSRPDEFL